MVKIKDTQFWVKNLKMKRQKFFDPLERGFPVTFQAKIFMGGEAVKIKSGQGS